MEITKVTKNDKSTVKSIAETLINPDFLDKDSKTEYDRI